MRSNRANQKSGMLALLAGCCILFATTANAEESIFSNVNLFKNIYLSDVMEGDVQLVSNHLTSLNLSTESQTKSARYVGQHGASLVQDSGVHLSWKIAW